MKAFGYERQILIEDYENILFEMENENEVDVVERKARIKTHEGFLKDRKENKIIDNLIKDMIKDRKKAYRRKKAKDSVRFKQR